MKRTFTLAIVTMIATLMFAQEPTANYPTVTNLAAENTTEGVVLTWLEPLLEAPAPAAITDDFEAYTPFVVNEAGEWSFIDGDQTATFGFNGITFNHMLEPMAYITFDTSFDTQFSGEAHSGNNVMACFAAQGVVNDDWMISPELSGEAQTISFFAKTYMDYGYEEFMFLYSTTGKEIDDFTVLAEVHDVPLEWTEYRYDVPAGAKYFAIRCISNDRFIFMVDDVTYIPANSTSEETLTLVGYNVYRDGVKLNAEPITNNTYVDTPDTGEYTYTVTAVYTQGESAASNAVVVVSATGLEEITANTLSSDVYTVTGILVRKAGEPLTGLASGIYIMNGKKIIIK